MPEKGEKMSILFKDRDARGKPLAKVSVEFWVIREDLVTAAIRVLDEGFLGLALEEEIAASASKLTKRSIEKRLKEDLAYKGQEWFEYEIGPTLHSAESEPVYRAAAEAAVTRLWPGTA